MPKTDRASLISVIPAKSGNHGARSSGTLQYQFIKGVPTFVGMTVSVKEQIKSSDTWITDVYGAKDRASLEQLYDQWADSYDADLVQTGYLHGAVIAGLMAAHVPRREAAVLDAGVGTGAIGGILSILGYNNLTGIDMSEGMLAKARERRCYIDLRKAVLGETLPFPDGAFDAIFSTGTFTTGHAPASGLDELVRIMEPGGVLMVTIGTVVFEEAGFKTKLETLSRSGLLKPIETTPIYRPMPHSPSEGGFTTRAHVLRKALIKHGQF